STNNGGAWTEIVAADPDDGSYDWTVPTVDSAQCLVRVTATDKVGQTGSDQSNATFTIDSTAPVVTVTSPNGAEYLKGGSVHTITWTVTETNRDTVKLEYSTNGGGAWTEIVAADPDDGSYDWTVPDVDSAQCLVRVTATDKAGNTGSDVSNATFTIDSTDPVIAITAPTAGALLRGGTAQVIAWTTIDANPDTVKIEFSSNDGGSWTVVAASEADDGSYDWAVPVVSGQCALRLTATDRVGRTDSDEVHFVVDSTPPAIAIVSVKQDGIELLGGRAAGRGTVDIQVTASDALAGLAAVPAVVLHFSDASTAPAIYANESPAGTFNYTYLLTGATPNGACQVTASVADLAGNNADADPEEFDINVRVLTATVELEGYTGSPGALLTLRFAFTDAAGTVLGERRDVQVPYTNGRDTESVIVGQVPEGTVNVSCKEVGHFLRRRVAIAGAGSDLTASFEDDNKLLGGDYNNDNFVELTDFAQFCRDFSKPSCPESDINGDGDVDSIEFGYIGMHFFQLGDPE
ncbi:MAG TPA: hypothetical protein VMZ50_01480, partial [Phycisphaerae bacterium]|nr:hypothetical protein [Phycisphaerae bacterium]